jgi:Amidohydrolase
LSRAEHPEALMIPGGAPAELYLDPAFRAGVSRLGERGFTFDTWLYHYQIHELVVLARAVPGTTMVLDHFGTPLGVGPCAPQRDEIYEQWKLDIAQLARCDNVVAKLGGLAMPDNGFGWDKAPRPPTSDEFVAARSPYYLHTIEVFGPQRCMFESNFPVDRFSLSYRVLWNGFKKLTADFEASERVSCSPKRLAARTGSRRLLRRREHSLSPDYGRARRGIESCDRRLGVGPASDYHAWRRPLPASSRSALPWCRGEASAVTSPRLDGSFRHLVQRRPPTPTGEPDPQPPWRHAESRSVRPRLVGALTLGRLVRWMRPFRHVVSPRMQQREAEPIAQGKVAIPGG